MKWMIDRVGLPALPALLALVPFVLSYFGITISDDDKAELADNAGQVWTILSTYNFGDGNGGWQVVKYVLAVGLIVLGYILSKRGLLSPYSGGVKPTTPAADGVALPGTPVMADWRILHWIFRMLAPTLAAGVIAAPLVNYVAKDVAIPARTEWAQKLDEKFATALNAKPEARAMAYTGVTMAGGTLALVWLGTFLLNGSKWFPRSWKLPPLELSIEANAKAEDSPLRLTSPMNFAALFALLFLGVGGNQLALTSPAKDAVRPSDYSQPLTIEGLPSKVSAESDRVTTVAPPTATPPVLGDVAQLLRELATTAVKERDDAKEAEKEATTAKNNAEKLKATAEAELLKAQTEKTKVDCELILSKAKLMAAEIKEQAATPALMLANTTRDNAVAQLATANKRADEMEWSAFQTNAAYQLTKLELSLSARHPEEWNKVSQEVGKLNAATFAGIIDAAPKPTLAEITKISGRLAEIVKQLEASEE